VKRVLVTGASGFIGQHTLAPLESRGFEVHATSRHPAEPSVGAVNWHVANLLDLDEQKRLLALVRPTHLLHLAWFVVPGQLITSPENYDWVTASLALVRAFIEHGGQRSVVCGSGYEYDWNYGYCSEKLTPLVPDTVYGASKHALDVLLRSLAESTGTSAAWGRVFFLYGPDEHPKRLVSSVIRSLLSGQPAPCSHGRQIRDYMHVQDVADGLVRVLDSEITGAVNVCSGRATALRDIVLGIGRLLGRPELVQLGAIPARSNDKALVVGDNQRLVAELGYEEKFDLESGLTQTIDWWRGHMRNERGRSA
jgi:nucleoside-diphosphate-sugar epimerase